MHGDSTIAATSRHFSSVLDLFRSVSLPFRHRQSYSSLVYIKFLIQKIIPEIKRTNVGNHKIILGIKRTRQESNI